MKKNIVVFGAGGRIGLPLSAWFAGLGANVTGVELDDDYVDLLNTGLHVPFTEKGLKEALQDTVIAKNKLSFISYLYPDVLWERIKKADVIVVCVGTPLNEDTGVMDQTSLNKVFDLLMLAPEDAYMSLKLIMLRSTVPVGTTDALYKRWCEKTGKNPNLVFWPERVLEGDALNEFSNLPNIFGFPEGLIFTGTMYQTLYDLRGKGSIMTTAKEAEFIKVSANMVRYVEFALANELMMLADKYGIEFNTIHGLMKRDYPRLNSLKAPGVNVGGPCLSKDWAALKFSTLIRDSHLINCDDVVRWTVNKLIEKNVTRVLILGASFKANSDDMRGSGLESLTAFLENANITYHVYDPHVPEYSALPLNDDLEGFDGFLVFTPHDVFEDGIYKNILKYANKNAWFFNHWYAYGALNSERPVFQIKDAVYHKTLGVDWYGTTSYTGTHYPNTGLPY